MGLDLVQAGSVLGDRYEIRRLIRSAPGLRVWEAFDPILHRAVVVDTLDPRNTGATREAFLGAALRSARCTNHGVISVYDTGNERGTAYVVSESVRGTPLETVIAEQGPLPIDVAAALTCEAADALSAAHAVELFHGALQASTILVTTGNRVKIGGFGGPPTGDRYCAPELLDGNIPSEATDVYALAVCTVEMLHGDAFDPRSMTLTDALDARDDVPDAARAALDRALDPDPASRAAHVRALHRVFAPVRGVVLIAPDQQATEAVPVVTPDPTMAVPLAVVPDPTSGPATRPSPEEHLVSGHKGMSAFVITLLVIALVAIVLGVLAFLKLRNPLDVGTSGGPGAQPQAIANVQDFDPFGDNRQENHAAVGNTHDGDLNTVWSSEIYNTPAFGNAKPGIGLRIDLAEPSKVSDIVITSATPGWAASVYVGDGSATTLDGWGQPVAQIADAPESATMPVASKPKTRSVLVWFTTLPEGGQMSVREVQVLG